MTDTDELAGRIDGVARALMTLCATLEVHGVIDGPSYTAALRGVGRAPLHLANQVSLHTLAQIADQLDAARAIRQSWQQPDRP